jgi:hypothetical protein
MGLVGPANWVGADPFDEASNSVMTGLEEDRPLYLYEAKGAKLIPKDVIFLRQDASRTKIAKFGTPTVSFDWYDSSRLSCRHLKSSTFIWPIAPTNNPGAGQRFEFDGNRDRKITLAIEPGSLAALSFRLHSEGPLEETLPQMPILSDAIAIYRTPWGFRVKDAQKLQKWWSVRSGSGGTDFYIIGVEGCFMDILESGSMLGRLPVARLSGTWKLGRGFDKHYWHGEITDWVLSKTSAPFRFQGAQSTIPPQHD